MPAQCPSQTILIVDDTPASLGLIMEILEQHQFRVLIAQDGEEGLERAKHAQPDLILLDVMMPGLDGFEVCRRLKQHPDTCQIPVIFMTSLHDTDNKVSGFEAGGVDYVTKPLRVGEVLARINTHLKLQVLQRQLAGQNAQLQRYQTKLEQLVHERTAELNRTNQALQAEAVERQKAQERLVLIDYALNHVTEAAYMVDMAGTIAYVNKMATEVLGYCCGQSLEHLNLFTLDKPLTQVQWVAQWQRLQQEKRVVCESDYLTQAHGKLPMEVTACYFEYAKKTYALCIVRDISEQKQVLTLLHAREQEFRSLVEHSPDLVARLNLQFEYTYANPALLATLELTPDSILARHPEEVLPNHGFSNQFVRALKHVVANRVEHAAEMLMNPGNYQNPKVYSFRFVPEFNQEGRFDSILAIGRDVSILKEAERNLVTLTENIPDIIARFDHELRYLFLNSAMEKVFGVPAHLYLGKPFGALMSHSKKVIRNEDFNYVKELISQTFNTATPIASEFVWHTPGAEYVFESRFIPELDAAGAVSSVLVITRDITERKRAEEKQRLAASVFATTSEGIIVTDSMLKIVYINNALSQITGFDTDELIGRSFHMFDSEFKEPLLFQKISHQLKEKGHWSGDLWSRRKSGEVYPQRMTISTVYTEQGKVANYVSIVSDISELKEQEQKLETLAYYDALTGVANRVLLNEKMREAIDEAQREGFNVAIAYFDLDEFKGINDSFGHEAGDQILIEITKRVGQELRMDDTLARLGGDEFVLLLPRLKQDIHYEHLLNRLLEAIAMPIPLENQTVSLTASFGVTLYPTDDAAPDTLLRHADQAMYQAKQAGKNRIQLYDAELDKQISWSLSQHQRIAQAIKANEFELYYQPKVNLTTMRVVGAEALIRWNKPGQGIVGPMEFLPLLEKSDLAVSLDHWVIHAALQQMAAWHQKRFSIPISINLSARSLSYSNFSELLQNLLGQYATVNPEHFELEILEYEAIHDLKVSSEVMRKCLSLGVKFSLDDFGTGYSSLSHLRHLPAQTLKIDQSFVRDMLEDEENSAIVQGVISLAQAFKRQVIAEGVETQEHCKRLLAMGCTIAQGYYIAKPMPAKAFAEWVAAWQVECRCL